MKVSPISPIAVRMFAAVILFSNFCIPVDGAPSPAPQVQSDSETSPSRPVEPRNAEEVRREPVEIVAIRKTLVDYIEGSTQGQPERLRKAFHENLNLYSIRNGQLSVWAGTDYIADTKEGESTGELGRVLSIDFENDIAVAKVEIKQPRQTAYIDYFMLLKIGDEWKIVHKMYTRQTERAGRVELEEPDKTAPSRKSAGTISKSLRKE